MTVGILRIFIEQSAEQVDRHQKDVQEEVAFEFELPLLLNLYWSTGMRALLSAITRTGSTTAITQP